MKINFDNKKILSKKTTVISLLSMSLIASFLIVYTYYAIFSASTFDLLTGALYAPNGKIIERLWGPNRYSTAAGISKNYFPTPAANPVILVSGENWPDALAGTVLARTVNGPVLITSANSMDGYALGEMKRLGTKKVYVIGGTASVSDTVLTTIRNNISGVSIERIAGANRYTTSALVADKVYVLHGNTIPNKTAFVVTGENFSDALSAGSIAGAKKYPILLTNSTSLSPEVAAQIKKMGITKTVVVGGETSVSAAVYSAIPSTTKVRIAGADRYQTSLNLIDWAAREQGMSFANLGIATGENWPDALTGAAFAASKNGLLLLTPYNMTSLQANYVQSKSSLINRVTVFGGESTVSPSTMLTLGKKLGINYTQSQIDLQRLVDSYIQACPLLVGTYADYGDARGYQAIAYIQSGRIIVSPSHSASLSRIIAHEIYHVYDWRDNNRIDWGESIPPYPKPACMP